MNINTADTNISKIIATQVFLMGLFLMNTASAGSMTEPMAPAYITATSPDTTGQESTMTLAQSDNGQSKAEIAKDAYDPEDAKPVENWFGCQPQITDTDADSQSESVPASENCDPEASANDDGLQSDG